MEKTNLVFAFFVAAILAGLFLQYSAVPVPANKETFMQQEIGMPLNERGMGPYDQIGSSTISGWAASEATPVSQSPANNPIDTNKLMLLAGNPVSTECCPSTFNTDMGCICLTEQDRRLFASRGGNRA